VLERDVGPGSFGVREELLAVEQVGLDVDAPAVIFDELGPDRQLAVDVRRPAVADGQLRGHRGKAVPGREEARRLVERGGDEPAVDEPRPGLVLLAE
jgi:hypothetical protein